MEWSQFFFIISIFQVIVWDFKNYKVLRKLTEHRNHVSACEFSIDGAILATASYDTRVVLWDPYTGEVLSQFR